MDWFTAPPDLTAAEAAWIARDLRTVALADGHVHEREVALIATFEQGLSGVDGEAPPEVSPEVRNAWLRSLIMVALADGRISDAEHQVIRDLADHEGLGAERVESEIREVKRRFLRVFAGVDVFRDAVVRVAEELGLPPSEIDALRQEA